MEEVTCAKCKNLIFNGSKFCEKCGAQTTPGFVWVGGKVFEGCWRIVKIVVGLSLVLGGIPWLFTPGFVGGVLLMFVGFGVIQGAVED